MMRTLFALIPAAALVFAGACSDQAETLAPDDASLRMTKVDVCHLDEYGNYILINIAEAAYDTHLAHGDAGVGTDYPDKLGYKFDSDCSATPIPGVFGENLTRTYMGLTYSSDADVRTEGSLTGTVVTVGLLGNPYYHTFNITCIKIEDNEAWFGGESDDGKFTIFYAADGGEGGQDYFSHWYNVPATHSCANLGSYTPPDKEVTGELVIN